MRQWRGRGLTAENITRVILPVIYTGTSLRLLAVIRRSQDPAVREMAVALAAVAAAGSTLPPSALRTFQDVLGDANYARFLSQIGTVVAAGTGNDVLIRSAYDRSEADPRVHSRRQRMLGTLMLMTVLFARDRATAAELQAPTDRLFQPLPALYWVALSQFMVQTAGETAYLAFSTSRLTRDGALRGGLRCLGTGTLLLSAYYGQHVAGVVSKLLVPRLPGPIRGVPAQAVIGSAAALVAAGASLPGLVWRTRLLRQAADDARTAAGLRALWLPFRSDNHATLGVGAGSPGLRLYRRVLEVLEGLDRLAAANDPYGRLHQAAAVIGRRERLDDEDVIALARAALIRQTAQATGPAQPAPPAPETATAHRSAATTAKDWRTDARRLLRAAHFLRHSPLVGETVEQLHAPHPNDRRTITLPDAAADMQGETASGCTCLPPDSYKDAILEYAVGREERDQSVRELAAQCAVHADPRV